MSFNGSNNYNNSMNRNTFNKEELPKWLSWPVIIITFIFFWPLGIYFIWKRIDLDKKSQLNLGRNLIITGLVLIGLSIIYLFAAVGDPAITVGEMISAVLLMGSSGAGLIILGKRSKKNAEKIKKYISLVVNQEVTSIEDIATAMALPYEITQKDIQKMIDKGYFAGAYINEISKEIVLPNNHKQDYKKQEYINANKPNAEMLVVTCKGCGANNKVLKGSVVECEFCGSPVGGN